MSPTYPDTKKNPALVKVADCTLDELITAVAKRVGASLRAREDYNRAYVRRLIKAEVSNQQFQPEGGRHA
jgi:hypothetical protein